MEFEEAVRRMVFGEREAVDRKPSEGARRRKEEPDACGSSRVDCSLAERELPASFYHAERWAPSEVKML